MSTCLSLDPCAFAGPFLADSSASLSLKIITDISMHQVPRQCLHCVMTSRHGRLCEYSVERKGSVGVLMINCIALAFWVQSPSGDTRCISVLFASVLTIYGDMLGCCTYVEPAQRCRDVNESHYRVALHRTWYMHNEECHVDHEAIHQPHLPPLRPSGLHEPLCPKCLTTSTWLITIDLTPALGFLPMKDSCDGAPACKALFLWFLDLD